MSLPLNDMQRRAIGLQMAAAVRLELQWIPGVPDGLQDEFLGRVQSTAVSIANKADPGQCEAEIDDLDRWARRRLAERAGDVPPAFGDAVDAFLGDVSRCEGDGLGDLSHLQHFVEEKVAALYTLHTGDAALPHVDFGAYVEMAPHHFGPGFSINGFTDVRQRAVPLVGLEYHENRCNPTALCQILYVLVHEMVCHAYQSLHGDLRHNADDCCSWSDAWMDVLAWHLTERYIDEDATLPAWIVKHPEQNKAACRSLHERRFDRAMPAGKLRRSDLSQRCFAREAFHALRREWTGAATDSDAADRRITRFSILLNHCPLTRKERLELVSHLNTGLLAPPLRRRVAECCSEYIAVPDPKRLLRQLDGVVTLGH